MNRRLLPFALGLLVGLPSASVSQDVPTTSPEPGAVFAEPFSRISGLREMPDGRLLIADRTEQLVAMLDFAHGTVEQMGREGEGPGEYQNPVGLFPLPGDATLLADMGNMRMTVIAPTGELGPSYPIMRPGGDQGFLIVRPEDTDAQGRVYFSNAGVIAMRSGGPPVAQADSAPILRMLPDEEAYDTVGMVALPRRRNQSSPIRIQGGGSIQVAGAMPQPYAPRDDWAVAPNGDVVVVRADPYRVDRYGTDGRLRSGPELRYEPVRITRAVKEAWAEQMSQTMASFRMSGGEGQTMRLQAPDIDDVEFPDFMPPFVNDALFVAPDGEVWVATATPPDQPRSYDVFDSGGRLVRRVRLPAGRELVAIGTRDFYAVAIDHDDLQWLERYER